MCVIGMFHHPLAATVTAKPVTQAMAAMTRPCASRKLRSLGTRDNTRASAPASHAQESRRAFLAAEGAFRPCACMRVLFVSLVRRPSTRLRTLPGQRPRLDLVTERSR
jgi:hypothetical protein